MKINVKMIQAAMIRKCMDCDAIAKAVGMSSGNIYRVLKTGKCRIATASKIAKALEVDPRELVEL